MTTTSAADPGPKPPINKAAMLARYIAERDKRLRPDGNAQYGRLTGRLADYLNDPYTPFEQRESKTDHVTFAFVGGGFAGLVTCARLVEAGVRGVRIIEKGGGFGGTWYWNRYPGAQMRHGVYGLYAASRGDGPPAERKVRSTHRKSWLIASASAASTASTRTP